MTRALVCLLSLILCMCSCSQKHKKEIVYSDKAPAPIGPYSQAVRSGGSLFVSGQIALTASGKLDTSSIENECRQVLENIKNIVEAGGMSLQDVTKCSIYLIDLNNFSKVNKVYQDYFPKDPPARETVQVEALPKGAHIEISAIAK